MRRVPRVDDFLIVMHNILKSPEVHKALCSTEAPPRPPNRGIPVPSTASSVTGAPSRLSRDPTVPGVQSSCTAMKIRWVAALRPYVIRYMHGNSSHHVDMSTMVLSHAQVNRLPPETAHVPLFVRQSCKWLACLFSLHHL